MDHRRHEDLSPETAFCMGPGGAFGGASMTPTVIAATDPRCLIDRVDWFPRRAW
jgi:hypothetical protein